MEQEMHTHQVSVLKSRKKYHSSFLTKLFGALEVWHVPLMKLILYIQREEYPGFIRWSEDGTQIELLKSNELAANVFAKMYKHSNLSSFKKQVILKISRNVRSKQYSIQNS